MTASRRFSAPTSGDTEPPGKFSRLKLHPSSSQLLLFHLPLLLPIRPNTSSLQEFRSGLCTFLFFSFCVKTFYFSLLYLYLHTRCRELFLPGLLSSPPHPSGLLSPEESTSSNSDLLTRCVIINPAIQNLFSVPPEARVVEADSCL